jgi:DinB superfamily
MHDWMLNTLNKGPKIVERLLRVFPTDRLDDRIEKDRFTAREVVAHLADYEQDVLDRIRVANLKPGHTVPLYDPDARCREHHFFDKEIFHEAEVFESRREMTYEYLMALTEEDWAKTFVRDGYGAVTIHEYVGMVLAHDVEHIEQLSAYLATEVATIL